MDQKFIYLDCFLKNSSCDSSLQFGKIEAKF